MKKTKKIIGIAILLNFFPVLSLLISYAVKPKPWASKLDILCYQHGYLAGWIAQIIMAGFILMVLAGVWLIYGEDESFANWIRGIF